MTKREALDKKYCKYCAAYGARGWNCGVTTPGKNLTECILPADVQLRFKEERGLEGETIRHIKGNFGDRDLMKKPIARRRRRT